MGRARRSPSCTRLPYFRDGYLSHVRGTDVLIKTLLPDASHFPGRLPTTLSSDVLHLGARIRAAQAKGTLDRLEISPALMAKKKGFDQLQADMPQAPGSLLRAHCQRAQGQAGLHLGHLDRCCTTWPRQAWHAAREASLRGFLCQHHAAAPRASCSRRLAARSCSLHRCQELNESYSMSEVAGASHTQCEHGHFHFAPTTFPFLLDPETSKPLPRTGRVTGRAAFFDLGAETRWGGFITGDEVTVEVGQGSALRAAEPLHRRRHPALQREERRRRQDHLRCHRRLAPRSNGFPEHP
jgi:hypothetical protein